MTTTPLPEPMWPQSGRDRPYEDAYSAANMQAYAAASRADLEAEVQRLRDLLGKATALARIRFEHIRRLQGRSANEDNSDCHGPDWTDRESEYLK